MENLEKFLEWLDDIADVYGGFTKLHDILAIARTANKRGTIELISQLLENNHHLGLGYRTLADIHWLAINGKIKL